MPQQSIGGSLFNQRRDFSRRGTAPRLENPMSNALQPGDDNDHVLRRPMHPELSRYSPAEPGQYANPANPVNNDHSVSRPRTPAVPAAQNPVGGVTPPASAYDPNRQKPEGIPQALWDQSRQQAAQDNAFAQRAAQNPVAPAWQDPSSMGYSQGGTPQSSAQAGMAAGLAPVGPDGMDPLDARRANGYAGMQSPLMGTQEAYQLAQQSAINRVDVPNPMGDGSRFRQGSAMMNQANAIAAGMASSTGPNATTYELPQGYGNAPVYNPLRPAPEVQYRSGRDGQQVSYLPQDAPGMDPVLARQNAALKNRGSEAWQADRREKAVNRKERRAAETERRADVKFKHMVSQGMNPMSPQAKALFPAQTGGLRGSLGHNLEGTPLAHNAPLTPGNAQQAETMRNRMLAGYVDNSGQQHPPDPIWSAIGAGEGATVRDVHFGLYDYLNGGSALAPDDLESLHQYAVLARQGAVDGEDPFKISRWYSMAQGWGEESARAHEAAYSALWKELSEIPVGSPPEVLQKWESKYRNAQNTVRGMAQAPSGRNNPARMSSP